MHSGPITDISKDILCHGKMLGDLASVLEEVDAGRKSKSSSPVSHEGAIPLKNYHQMVQALRNELRIPLAKETLPEDLDLFSIFKVPAADINQSVTPHTDALHLKEIKTTAHRCLVAGISRYYNNVLMGIQGNLSLIIIDLGCNHPYLPIIKSAEELVHSGSYAISLLLGYLAERRSQTRRIRFNHLVTEVAAMQSYIPEENDRQRFEQWIQKVPKMDGLTYLAEKCMQSFNRLLRGIAIWAEWIRIAGEVDYKIAGRLLKIKELVETGYWISERLMAFAGKGSFNLQKVTLKKILGPCCDEFKQRHPDIRLKVYQRSPGIALLADPGHLNQALQELMQNAADSMPDGGRLTLSVKKIELAQRRSNWILLNAGSYVMITVKDIGKGLDGKLNIKEIERVFDPFFTTKSFGKRLGLGLSMVYGVAKQLGGAVAINFKAESGYGTKVNLLLPQI